MHQTRPVARQAAVLLILCAGVQSGNPPGLQAQSASAELISGTYASRDTTVRMTFRPTDASVACRTLSLPSVPYAASNKDGQVTLTMPWDTDTIVLVRQPDGALATSAKKGIAISAGPGKPGVWCWVDTLARVTGSLVIRAEIGGPGGKPVPATNHTFLLYRYNPVDSVWRAGIQPAAGQSLLATVLTCSTSDPVCKSAAGPMRGFSFKANTNEQGAATMADTPPGTFYLLGFGRASDGTMVIWKLVSIELTVGQTTLTLVPDNAELVR